MQTWVEVIFSSYNQEQLQTESLAVIYLIEFDNEQIKFCLIDCVNDVQYIICYSHDISFYIILCHQYLDIIPR